MPSKKGSLFSGGSTAKSGHRRQKRNSKRMISYLLEYFGDQLYYLGATIEREFKNTWRAIRRGIKRFFTALWRGIVAVFSFAGRAFVTIFNDIVNPFRKLGRSIKSLSIVMKETRKQGFRARMRRLRQFFKYGWMWNKHLVTRFLNHLLPTVAAVALVFVIYSMLNLNFALAVNYNGEMVGYVANEQVYDSAQRIIQGRIIEADESSWSASDAALNMTIVPKEELSSQTKMADSLLTVSGNEIEEATGLYIDGQFYGATSSGEDLNESLESLKEPYLEQVTDESTDIRFSREVELVTGIYPEGSVKPLEELDTLIHSATQDAVYHTVAEDETPKTIAEANGLSVEQLEMLNEEIDLDDIQPGDSLLIAEEAPFLAAKLVKLETELEEIEIKMIETRDSRFSASYVSTITEGKAGLKEIQYEVEYENGVEVSRTVIGEVILEEMVEKYTIRGTKTNVLGGQAQSSGGQLAWPTGPYQFISRGWTGTHKAIDIAGQYATAIKAADGGTVVTSGWSDSGYGYHIIIDHGNGMQTLYAHCSELFAQVGQTVARNEVIAAMGSTGNSTGNHLHFEVRLGGERVPTEPYLGLG